MAQVTENEDVQITGQTRPVRNVISYIRTLDGSAHPALDSINGGVVFDAAKSVYTVELPIESLNDKAEQEAKLFAESLQSYEAEVPKKYKTEVNIHQPHSIADVIKQIDSSLNEYKRDNDKTAWQAIRKGFWKLSENHEGLEGWLQILPSTSEYTSLIYGGINLILKAAGRIGEVRNDAFSALAAIPYHLESTREAVGIFDKSEALRKCGVRLYTVTLDALGHILTWFKTRAVGKAFGALLKQGLYQRQLQTKITEIQTVSTHFKDISMSCLQRGVANTERTVTSLAVASTNNHVIIKETLDQNNTILHTQLERVNQTLQDFRLEEMGQHESTQQVVENELKALRKDQLESKRMTAESLNNIRTLLESIFAALPVLMTSEDPSYVHEQNQEPQTDSASSSQILSELKHEKDLCQIDLLQSLRAVGQMSRSEQDRAVWIMKSHSLWSWLTSTTSSSLFLNGFCPSTRARSPLTFLCARLVESLKSNSEFLVLHFFCGQHISSTTDPNATPLGMMNSLLAQLLILYPNFEISNHDLASISTNTLPSILLLFSTLVSQLPPTVMLFLVIDGISLYEDAARLPETMRVINELRDLVAREVGPVVKVLLTSPTRIKNLPKEVGKDEVLNVPRDVVPQAPFSTLRNGKVRLNMN